MPIEPTSRHGHIRGPAPVATRRWAAGGAVLGVLAAAAGCGSTADTPAASSPVASVVASPASSAVPSAVPAVPTTPAATRPAAPTTTAPVVAPPTTARRSTAPASTAHPADGSTAAPSPPVPTGPAGGAAFPTGFTPVAFSATSADRWFVLGTDANNRAALLTTANAGTSWRSLPLPAAARGPVGGRDRPGIAFSDATSGLVTVGGGFWATPDGGRTWRNGGPGNAEVLEVAAGPGGGYALLHTASGGYFLGRAAGGSVDLQQALGGDRFTTTVPHLATSGTTVLVVSGNRTLRSTDGGHTFTSSRGPCLADLGGSVSAAGSTVLAWCATGMQGGGFVSTDRGASFARTAAGGSNAAAAAPTGFGSDFVYAGPAGLRVTDRTGTGRPARGGIGTIGWVGFTSPRSGFAIASADGAPDGLWRSTDAGLSWTRVGAR